jgi:xanthine dehydrogenase YagT iron-sulfur-binding subunit
MSKSTAPDRVFPPSVGDTAPDFECPAGRSGVVAGQRLSHRRGGPVIVAFHEPCWDPARDVEINSHRQLIGGESSPEPTMIRNDDPAAAVYGVTGGSAVFVIDARGKISWRHVRGVDSLDTLAAANAGEVRCDIPDLERPGWSRREFIATALGTAIALTLDPFAGRAQAEYAAATGGAVPAQGSAAVGAAVPVTLTVNGQPIDLSLEPRVTLLDALREYAGLTGSKKGCDHGQCGACTVHVDGRRTLSCLTLAVMQQGKAITTIEGLAASGGARGDTLHPMQQAFIEHDGFQCGYCTSGQIMSASAMMREPWGSGDDDVREAMSGNLCRCGAYAGIVAAVQDVRHNGEQRR